MEKIAKSRTNSDGTVVKEQMVGSWQLPSGNVVKGHLLHSDERIGLHMEIGKTHPFSVADVYAYAGFVVPDAQRRATLLLERWNRRKSHRKEGGRA